MVVITVEKCREANIDVVTIENSDLFWIKINDVQQGLGVQNISDLVTKEKKGIFNTDNPTNVQINKYKRSAANLMNNHNKFSNQVKYACSDLIEKIIKNCREVKKI